MGFRMCGSIIKNNLWTAGRRGQVLVAADACSDQRRGTCQLSTSDQRSTCACWMELASTVRRAQSSYIDSSPTFSDIGHNGTA